MGKTNYHWDLIAANLLFGANFSFFYSLTRNDISFHTLFILQVTTAALFFIPAALTSRRAYHITRHDAAQMLLVALLVIVGWMYMLLWGASYTTPIDAAIIATLGPAFTQGDNYRLLQSHPWLAILVHQNVFRVHIHQYIRHHGYKIIQAIYYLVLHFLGPRYLRTDSPHYRYRFHPYEILRNRKPFQELLLHHRKHVADNCNYHTLLPHIHHPTVSLLQDIQIVLQ